jgi:putative ABC transport system substrate-binding protein
MRRREFIGLLGGAVAVWPFVALGQSTVPEIGYLNASSPTINPEFLVAFRRGLAETGYVEGQNVTIEYRWRTTDTMTCPRLPTTWFVAG